MEIVFSKIKRTLKPFDGIIYFVVILLLSHFIWKFSIKSDDTDTIITLFGNDISTVFNDMAIHITQTTIIILNFLGINVELEPNNVIRHLNGHAVKIVWSCTGLKQAYIYICIILFYKGPFKHKLWYIPAGLVIVYLFNIFRISATTAIVSVRPQWFDFVHEELFKYLFYIVIFGMWILWEEKFVLKK